MTGASSLKIVLLPYLLLLLAKSLQPGNMIWRHHIKLHIKMCYMHQIFLPKSHPKNQPKNFNILSQWVTLDNFRSWLQRQLLFHHFEQYNLNMISITTPLTMIWLTRLRTLIFLVILWTRHVFENIDPKAIVNPISRVNTLAWKINKRAYLQWALMASVT